MFGVGYVVLCETNTLSKPYGCLLANPVHLLTLVTCASYLLLCDNINTKTADAMMICSSVMVHFVFRLYKPDDLNIRLHIRVVPDFTISNLD